jgi:hypothetical protein
MEGRDSRGRVGAEEGRELRALTQPCIMSEQFVAREQLRRWSSTVLQGVIAVSWRFGGASESSCCTSQRLQTACGHRADHT